MWYSGHYELRLAVAERVTRAAREIGDVRIQALMLVEDLGWTKIRLNNLSQGEDDIIKGIGLLSDYDNNFEKAYLLCKAYRNLANLYLKYAQRANGPNKQQPMEKCFAYLENASSELKKLKEETMEQIEMTGNVNYTYSLYYNETRQYNLALDRVNATINAYEQGLKNDPGNIDYHFADKKTKMYRTRGDIYLKKYFTEGLGVNDDLSNAAIAFERGLTNAKEYNVNVEVVKSSIGLFDVHKTKLDNYLNSGLIKDAENELRDCERILNDAKNYVETISDSKTKNDYEERVETFEKYRKQFE